jgi:hypothetical protein
VLIGGDLAGVFDGAFVGGQQSGVRYIDGLALQAGNA